MRPLLLAVALSVLASTTQAMEPRILFAPERPLEAGEVVTVRWTGLPGEVEELEFLLQRDDGDVVRLTEQLLPSSGSFGWIVPDLPSRGARLVLRAGIEGREITLASSEPFVIRGAAGRARLQFRDGEWWTIEVGPPSAEPPRVSPRLHARSPQTLSRTNRPLLVRARVEVGAAQPLERSERTTRAIDTHCGAPRTIPQRK